MKYPVDLFIQAVEVDTDKTPGGYLGNLLGNYRGSASGIPLVQMLLMSPRSCAARASSYQSFRMSGSPPSQSIARDSRFLYLVQDTVYTVRRGSSGSKGILCRCITVPAASLTGKAGFDLYCIDQVFFKKPDDFCMVRMKTPVGEDRTGIFRDWCTAHESWFRLFSCR